jgi:transcriptional regulator with XRE-family HTH domain
MGVKDPGKKSLASFVGRRLREIRLARGMRQEDLQEKGFNVKYYQRIEVGRVNLTLRSLEKLLSALNVKASALFQKRDSKKGRMPRARR